MTATANGAQVYGTPADWAPPSEPPTPGLDTAGTICAGEPLRAGADVGPDGPPPPPPPPPAVTYDALAAEVARLQRQLVKAQGPNLAQRLTIKAGRIPPRFKAYAGVGAVVVATTLGVRACAPRPMDPDQVAAIATRAATQQATNAVSGQLAQAKASSTQIVVPDAFNGYPPLTEDALTMIGRDPAANYLLPQQARAQVVATQVRALQAQFPLSAMRLTATSPTELKVVTTTGVGVRLFADPPASATAAPAATPASAAPTTATSQP